MVDMFVVLVADLSKSDGMPLAWREHGRYGNEPAAIRAAAGLRDNSRAIRVFAANDHELTMILAEQAAVDAAPATLHGTVQIDPNGVRTVIAWHPTREAAERQAATLTPTANIEIVVASGSNAY